MGDFSKQCFAYSSAFMIYLAGFPPHTSPDGTHFVTTEPAAMIDLSPIVTFGRIILLAPIKQLLPIIIFPNFMTSL